MKKMRILNIFPDISNDNIESELTRRRNLAAILSQDTAGIVSLETRTVPRGSVSIETAYDCALVAPYILHMCKQAEEEGFSAILLDCFMDPAFNESRQLVNIPVFGAGHSACSLAARMGGRFSIISLLEDMDFDIRQMVARYGFSSNLASIRYVNTPVSRLWDDRDTLASHIAEAAQAAVQQDRANVLVLGCTGLSEMIRPVGEKLKQTGLNAPFIEAFPAALYEAISCCLQGVSHSKLAYPSVHPKSRLLDFDY